MWTASVGRSPATSENDPPRPGQVTRSGTGAPTSKPAWGAIVS